MSLKDVFEHSGCPVNFVDLFMKGICDRQYVTKQVLMRREKRKF